MKRGPGSGVGAGVAVGSGVGVGVAAEVGVGVGTAVDVGSAVTAAVAVGAGGIDVGAGAAVGDGGGASVGAGVGVPAEDVHAVATRAATTNAASHGAHRGRACPVGRRFEGDETGRFVFMSIIRGPRGGLQQ